MCEYTVCITVDRADTCTVWLSTPTTVFMIIPPQWEPVSTLMPVAKDGRHE